ncbi:hypothetical protein PBAL39_14169 [Pedobacter sp. BAL39]|uniref:BamA/TamA family outer membrane protein n=1 Tax=Pedobacter sp. BAL39 TaxID=391596 RepID=UPI000155AC44|nr:BamA/TamA family outer membrane protein [Pedobacter sp. BAL39]EDM34709.1 hypothetical protein PBAL39_14169 [Pedobacter sp. BAL39]
MLKISILFIFLMPYALCAQNARNMMPHNNVVKDTANQTDLIDVAKLMFRISPKPIKPKEHSKLYFSVLPVSNALPGGVGNTLVTSTTAGMYLGPKATTNLSTASFAPYWNLHNRFGLPLRTRIWLRDNSWLFQGDTRFLVYPQNTWGLGSSGNADRILLDYNYIRFYQSALKRITPYFFAGIGYNLDYHFNMKSDKPNLNLIQHTGYKYGTSENSFSSGISLNLLYDTRNNSINPMPGCYANLIYRVNPVMMGSNSTWRSMYLDLRKYVSLNPAKPNQQNTLAFWSYFWTALDSKTPYLDLPSLGWDPSNRSGRGFAQNRYRGRSLLYFESEFRRDITEDGFLGFVVFANVTTLTGTGSMFQTWHPAAGSGLRIKLNKGSNTNFGIDYGISKGYSGMNLTLGEAF